MASKEMCISMGGQYGYQEVRIYQSEDSLLGTGSYGNVVKAKLDDLACAAKILHQVIFTGKSIVSRFDQECTILRDLKHPNIVQFLGMVNDPSSGHLILLMEMMQQSLTQFLELPPKLLPFYLQVNISHDIALAVAHLHRNRILHRDLSSNNILMTKGCQAKVTDFGMAKIAESNRSMTRSRVTQCPGTLVYMPPEALLTAPRYSEKLDIFSLGVLLIQIMTKKFPSPTNAQITIEDDRSPTGEIIVPVEEVKRRKADIETIPKSNALLPVALSCLKDKHQERPDAVQLCQCIEALKTTPAHVESSTQHSDLPSTCSPSSSPSAGQVEEEVNDIRPPIYAENPQRGRTPLHDAAEKGDVQEVKRLLSTPANINSRTRERDETALIIASRKGQAAVVELLIKANAILDIIDKDGWTALSLASSTGHVEVVKLLLNNKADFNICDKGGHTPLYIASQNGHDKVVKLLVLAGADLHIANTEYGGVPLGVAAEKGHIETVKVLLEGKVNVNHQDKTGWTALYCASRSPDSNIEVVRLLLEHNAGVDICTKGGLSPVYAASTNGRTDIVDLLIQAKADIDLATTELGSVPLGVAAQNGHYTTVSRLLEAKANINHKNKLGWTPLYCATQYGNVDVVRLLVDKRATINIICDKNGLSPLYIASQNGNTGIVDLLVQKGADIHMAHMEHGNTPLWAAAQNGHKQTVQKLLEAKANVNYQKKSGTTALFMAALSGHSEVVELLLKNGAKDIPTKYGDTGFSKAKAHNHSDVVALLRKK